MRRTRRSTHTQTHTHADWRMACLTNWLVNCTACGYCCCRSCRCCCCWQQRTRCDSAHAQPLPCSPLFLSPVLFSVLSLLLLLLLPMHSLCPDLLSLLLPLLLSHACCCLCLSECVCVCCFWSRAVWQCKPFAKQKWSKCLWSSDFDLEMILTQIFFSSLWSAAFHFFLSLIAVFARLRCLLDWCKSIDKL